MMLVAMMRTRGMPMLMLQQMKTNGPALRQPTMIVMEQQQMRMMVMGMMVVVVESLLLLLLLMTTMMMMESRLGIGMVAALVVMMGRLPVLSPQRLLRGLMRGRRPLRLLPLMTRRRLATLRRLPRIIGVQ
jgi:hypothetical protein